MLLRLIVACGVLSVVSSRHVGDLLCRKCGATITRQSEIINVTTPVEKIKYKYEFPIVGKNATVHVFQNPAGEVFHVASAKTAHLKYHGQASSDASWFPGMKWTICVCSRCGQHMGWYFEPEAPNLQSIQGAASEKKSFVGLILDYMISADCKCRHIDENTRLRTYQQNRGTVVGLPYRYRKF